MPKPHELLRMLSSVPASDIETLGSQLLHEARPDGIEGAVDIGKLSHAVVAHVAQAMPAILEAHGDTIGIGLHSERSQDLETGAAFGALLVVLLVASQPEEPHEPGAILVDITDLDAAKPWIDQLTTST